MSKETGGPAFPYIETGDSGVREGMTLRDYFAAKAMQALITEPSWGDGCTPTYCRMSEEKNDEAKMIAQSAYKLADAMLGARK